MSEAQKEAAKTRINVKDKEYRQKYEVNRMFNHWWKESFRPTPASGALRWEGDKYWTWGDLVPPVSFPFVIELKSYQILPISQMLTKSWDNALITWFYYGQTLGYCSAAMKELGYPIYPLLVYKENGAKHNRLVLQSSLFFRLQKIVLDELAFVEVRMPKCDPIVITDLEKFFVKVPRIEFEWHLLGRIPPKSATILADICAVQASPQNA